MSLRIIEEVRNSQIRLRWIWENEKEKIEIELHPESINDKALFEAIEELKERVLLKRRAIKEFIEFTKTNDNLKVLL